MENYTKLYWIIGIVSCLLLVGGFVVYRLLIVPPSSVPNTSSNTNTGLSNNTSGTNVQGGQPSGSTPAAGQSISVAIRDGSLMAVNDFKSDPETKLDPNNDGQYYLSGGLNPTPASTPYSTFYVEANQSFNITLLQEPIKESRLQAQQELLKKLGITEAQACALNYYVGIPAQINEIYAGQNLGFSFCPGATPL